MTLGILMRCSSSTQSNNRRIDPFFESYSIRNGTSLQTNYFHHLEEGQVRYHPVNNSEVQVLTNHPPFPAYVGTDPYVFISYSHSDKTKVYHDISHLNQDGLNIWYDEGIRFGVDWNERLAQAIEHCSMVLLFLSPDAADSPHVRDELIKAKSSGKPILVVHLEETVLSGGLQMQLARWQHLFRHKAEENDYWKQLRTAAFADPSSLDSLSSPTKINKKRIDVKDSRNKGISLSAILTAKVQEMWLDGFLRPTLEDGIEISPPMTLRRRDAISPVAESFSHSLLFQNCASRLLVTGQPGGGKTIQMLKFVEDVLPHGANVNIKPIPVVFAASSWVNKPGEPPTAQQNIRDWLDREFLMQYGFTKTLSRQFIEGPQRLIYCLDGYDEIGGIRPSRESSVDSPAEKDVELDSQIGLLASEEYRQALRTQFLRLLHQFISTGEGEHAKGFLISSRTSNVPELHEISHLGFSELQINSLSSVDVLAYLDTNRLTMLRALCSRQEILTELTNPLQLQIFSTVYPSTHPVDEIERFREQAYQDYTAFLDTTYKNFFDRKLLAFQNAAAQSPESEAGPTTLDIHHFTRKIARYLVNSGRETFRLDRIQPSELPVNLQSAYLWINAALFLIMIQLLAGIPNGLAVFSGHAAMHTNLALKYGALATLGVGLISGSLIGLGYRFLHGAFLGAIVGLAFAVGRAVSVWLAASVPGFHTGISAALYQGTLSLVGVPVFAWILAKIREDPMRIVPVETWKTDKKNAAVAVAIGALVGVVFAFAGGLARGIAFGSSIMLTMGNRFSKKETDLPIQITPNQAINFSTKEARNHTIGITSAAVLIFGLAYGLGNKSLAEGINNAILALTFLVVFFFFGGIPVLKHLALRIVLARFRLLPWQSERFLTTAARAGLINQVGGGFQFSHTKIRDYFAAKAPKETWGIKTSRQPQSY